MPTPARRRQTPIEPQDVGRAGTDKVTHIKHRLGGDNPLLESASVLANPSIEAYELTATRTATGLVQASTQWTSSLATSAENPIDKRNIRTQ